VAVGGRLEVGVGGEAVVDAGTSGADTEDGVAFGKPVGEFLADAGLDFDDFVGIGLFPILEFGGEMDVGGTVAGFGSEFVNGGDDTLGLQVPFDEEAIRGHVAMERAGGDAVEIRDVFAGDGAETIDVEVGVFGFEGIEGPFDEADVAAKSVFTLKKLEVTTDAAITVGGKDAGHVRVEIGSGAMEADVGLGEADHEVAVEGAEDLAAGMVGDDVSDVGLDVEFGIGPDFAGDLDAAVEFGKRVKWADSDVRGHRGSLSYQNSIIR
jgi:hypothetical protein